MQYIDKNLIIERYINGSMSPAEIKNFHAMLEHDSELRSMFRAENMLNSTISRDRVALEAADHSRMYAKFLKNLADSIPQAAATASTGVSGSGATSWIANMATSVKLTISAAVLTGSLATGVIMYQNAQPEQVVPAPQIEAPAVSTPLNTPEQIAPAEQRNNAVSAPVRQDRATTQRPLPNTEQTRQIGAPATTAPKEDIPVIDKETLNVNMTTERKK